MEKNNLKAWLYLLPAILFLGVFMVYPLIDVLIYSFEEGYNSASGTYFGVGFYNFGYVLRDPYFLQAVKNTLILVFITVPVSTGLALLISLGLSSIEKLRNLFQTVYFLPYVTNTLAVGLVFMILFKPTVYNDGLVNTFLGAFGISPAIFGDPDAIREHLSTLLRELRESPKAEGATRIYTHGEKEIIAKADRLENGIDVNINTVAEMFDMCKYVGLNPVDYLGDVKFENATASSYK
jgi:ABC-type spermidine/putrescine transport system permease subunit II